MRSEFASDSRVEPEPELDLEPTTILQALRAHSSGRLLIDEAGKGLGAANVLDHSARIVATLRTVGVAPGETVAFALRNGPDAAMTILGLMAQGFTAVAINLQAGDKAMQYALEHSEARAVIVDQDTSAVIGPLTSAPIVSIGQFQEYAGVADAGQHESAPKASDIALIMYTSGTTGVPKGVQLSHLALLSGGKNTAQAHQLTDKDTALCVLPLYHINGLCVTLMAPLVSGGAVILPPKFSVKGFWPLIVDRSASWFSVVPTQISYLLHDAPALQPMPSLRFGRSASAPLSPAVQSAFEEKFGVKIIETMGMTETAAQLLSNPLPPGTRKVGSPGIAFGNDVKIVDPETLAELPRGQEGEVLIKGPNLMSGYLKNPKATAEALTDDGWLRSGDLGKMDAQGYVFITGRIKELIIKGGENIAPREIDEVLYSCPQVVEAAAFAVPCAQYGERPEAAVVIEVPSPDADQKLLALCIEQLGKFKAPTRVHILPTLPKGPSGKIQRLQVKALCYPD